MTHSCPYCRRALPADRVMLWDEREYCRSCVQQVSPLLCERATTPELLQETIPTGAPRLWNFLRVCAWWCGVILAICFGAVITATAFFVDLRQAAAVTILLGLFGLVLFVLVMALSLVVGVICYWSLSASLPRMILVDGQNVVVAEGRKLQRCGLAECSWHEGEATQDLLATFVGLRRGVTLQMRSGNYAVGHDREQAELFRAFLTLARVPKRQNVSFRSYIGSALGGCALGTLLGLLVASVASAISNDDAWLPRLTLLGLTDGLLAGLYLARLQYHHPTKARRAWLIVSLFALTGLRSGLAVGWPAGLAFAAANAMVGGLTAWLCQRSLRMEVQEQS